MNGLSGDTENYNIVTACSFWGRLDSEQKNREQIHDFCVWVCT